MHPIIIFVLRELQAETEKRLQGLKHAQKTQVEESKESQAKTQEEWEIKWQDMQTQVEITLYADNNLFAV